MSEATEKTTENQVVYKELMVQGLWKNNPGIVQLLGLCPLLAVTNTATNALRVHASHDAVAIRERLASTIIRRIREVGFG